MAIPKYVGEVINADVPIKNVGTLPGTSYVRVSLVLPPAVAGLDLINTVSGTEDGVVTLNPGETATLTFSAQIPIVELGSYSTVGIARTGPNLTGKVLDGKTELGQVEITELPVGDGYSENFDSYPNGSSPPGWSDPNVITVDNSEFVSSPNSARINGDFGTQINFAPLTGVVSAEVWARPHISRHNLIANVGIGLIHKNETNRYFLQGVPFADADGNWHHHKIIADLGAGTYDYYFDGVLIGGSIPTSLTSIDHFWVNSGRGGAGVDSWIDDIIIQQVGRLPISARINDVIFASGAYDPGDTISIGVNITNTGTESHTFNIGVSIGKDGIIWYDTGYYNDGYGDYRQATLAPGSSVTVTRSLTVPDDGRITDIWATVRDQDLNVLAQMKKTGVISVGPGINILMVRVINNATGNPVQGFSVKFDPAEGAIVEGVTDSSGNFSASFPTGSDIIVDLDGGADWRILPDGNQTYSYRVNPLDSNRTDTILVIPTPPPEIPPYSTYNGDFTVTDMTLWTEMDGWKTSLARTRLNNTNKVQSRSVNISSGWRNVYHVFWVVQQGTYRYKKFVTSANNVPQGLSIIRDYNFAFADPQDIGKWDFIVEVYSTANDLMARKVFVNAFDVLS